MQRTNHDEDGDGDGLVNLLRVTADDFDCLMAAHVKLARVELLADVKSLGRRLTMLAVLIATAFLGYSILWLGLAVVLSGWFDLAEALLLVGGLHLLGATGALLVAVRSLRNTNLMPETTYEANQSASTLATRILEGQASPASAPERTESVAQVINAEGTARTTHCGAAPVNGAIP